MRAEWSQGRVPEEGRDIEKLGSVGGSGRHGRAGHGRGEAGGEEHTQTERYTDRIR